MKTHVHECVGGTEDADRRGCAGLGCYNNGIVGKEATALGPEEPEALAQANGDMTGHPEMKGRGQQTGGVGTARKVVAEFSVDEISHALGGGGLLHVTLLPAVCLNFLLIFHHPEGTVARDVLGTQFDNHSAIGPLSATVGGTHAVDHYLTRTGGGGNDEPAGTHAEGIDSTTVNLGDEGILGGGKILPPTLLAVILYAVDQF